MKIIDLNGDYQLYCCKNNQLLCTATVPGSDFGALLQSGIITAQQLYDEKENAAFSESDMAFECSFCLEALDTPHAVLCCEKLDTLCDIYLNGQLIAHTENAHLAYRFEVKPYLKTGENRLRFVMRSPVQYITERQKEKPLPKNANGIDGAAYLRKPACHFGWDWGPCVPYKYIGDVKLKCFTSEIRLLAVYQKHRESCVTVTVEAENAETVQLFSPDGKEMPVKQNTFTIKHPQLWYSRDLNGLDEQPLYTLILKNSEMTVTKKLGLRTVTLNRERDAYGSNFQLTVNGQRVFAKGANLIPFAAIPEQADRATVDKYLALAVRANFNIIRVWGGAGYADEYLLEQCDRLGLLVWQDFAFACLMYPFYEPAFYDSVLQEVRQNVKRMTLHPCLALWCGNNEIEAMFNYLPKTTKLMKAYTAFFYRQLPSAIKDLTAVPYIPSSPLGEAPFEANTADSVGDTHLWNVWHGLQPLDYYGRRYTRFLSEFGLESLPSMQAIRSFAEEDSLDLSSKAFLQRQKCRGGNEKMLFYLQERFDLPDKFEALPYMTGLVQAECVQVAAEHFRRNKGRCNGAIFWQFNDVWSCPSWSAVDFLGLPKALLYKARYFFAPIALSLKEDVLYLHNDTLFDKRYTLQVGSKTVSVDARADSVVPVMKMRLHSGAAVKVTVDGLSYYFDRIKTLKRATFEVKTEGNRVILKTDTYARNIYAESEAIFEDNYFSLLPGEEKVLTADRPVKQVRVWCENNLEQQNGGIKKAARRLAYRLRPENIANFLYYQFN